MLLRGLRRAQKLAILMSRSDNWDNAMTTCIGITINILQIKHKKCTALLLQNLPVRKRLSNSTPKCG